MAGSLIKIAETTVTSAVASVTLTGIDSTYDVYMVRFNNFTPSVDGQQARIRFTVSGTPDTSFNYDYAFKDLRADTTFGNVSNTNNDYGILDGLGTGTSESGNGIMYLFNFNNASEYSFITNENTFYTATPIARGRTGGQVLTVAQAKDGIQFYMASGNIASGTFTLYGLKK